MTDVEGDPFADRSNRTPFYDEDTLLLVITLTERARNGRPWADDAWRPDTVAAQAAAAAAVEALPGYALSTSAVDLVAALTAAGATELRHAHGMSHPLTSLPRVQVGAALDVQRLDADQVDRHAERLAEISVRAYPADHPDHRHDTGAAAVGDIRAIGRGEILGAFMDQSTVAVVDGEIVGACLVVDREGVPPDGGPWIVEVFRDPDATVRRVGSALIASALANCRDAGLPGLSLAVSHSNAHAFAVYSALGFTDFSQSWTLALP